MTHPHLSRALLVLLFPTWTLVAQGAQLDQGRFSGKGLREHGARWAEKVGTRIQQVTSNNPKRKQ